MEYVLASLNPPSIWNLYPTREAAEAAKDEANTYKGFFAYPRKKGQSSLRPRKAA